jgi:hypothetical protein
MFNGVENQGAAIPMNRGAEFIAVQPGVGNLRATNLIFHFQAPGSFGVCDYGGYQQALPILLDVQSPLRRGFARLAPVPGEIGRGLPVNRNGEKQNDKNAHTFDEGLHKKPPECPRLTRTMLHSGQRHPKHGSLPVPSVCFDGAEERPVLSGNHSSLIRYSTFLNSTDGACHVTGSPFAPRL